MELIKPGSKIPFTRYRYIAIGISSVVNLLILVLLFTKGPLLGVDFAGVTTIAEQHEGVPILVVEGSVVNNTRKIVDVPRLKFVVRNAANEEIYSWTAVAPRATLPPGDAVAFRSRLASPPTDGRDVLVRFVTRHDIIGTR